MEARICCLVVLVVQMVCLVSATSRDLAANDDVGGVNLPGTEPLFTEAHFGSHLSSSQGGTAANLRGLEGIGSSPPSCEDKCYGCSPCQAIPVPTTTRKAQAYLSINYANYEPERWKCKCGPFFYSP